MITVNEFVENLFNTLQSDTEKFDNEIVKLIYLHFGQSEMLSKAGKNLAEALIELAKTRCQGGEQ